MQTCQRRNSCYITFETNHNRSSQVLVLEQFAHLWLKNIELFLQIFEVFVQLPSDALSFSHAFTLLSGFKDLARFWLSKNKHKYHLSEQMTQRLTRRKIHAAPAAISGQLLPLNAHNSHTQQLDIHRGHKATNVHLNKTCVIKSDNRDFSKPHGPI